MRIIAAVLLIAAGCSDSDSSPAPLIVTQIDTVVSTESAGIAFAIDIDVDSAGFVVVADYQANRVLRIDPTSGALVAFGRDGTGPGEFKTPWAVRSTPIRLFVVDQGNGRLQTFSPDGVYHESRPVTPMVMYSVPFIRADGALVIGSEGRDSSLVLVFDSVGERRRYGLPLVDPPQYMDFGRMRAATAKGEIPPEIRNSVLTASGEDGDVWMAIQTEGEVRRYDSAGVIKWSVVLDQPEFESTRAEFFSANAAETNGARFHSLQYFGDAVLAGEQLWLLLRTPETESAVVVVLSGEGAVERRIEIPGGGGASSLAVDPARDRLYLYTPHDAQLLSATIQLQ